MAKGEPSVAYLTAGLLRRAVDFRATTPSRGDWSLVVDESRYRETTGR